jgi:hypothetical protein
MNICDVILMANIIVGMYQYFNSTGKCQPPKNSNVEIVLISMILPYSARKNNANAIAEYSTLYPATSSASASGKSNGALFVSAKAETINKIHIGNSGITNQIVC